MAMIFSNVMALLWLFPELGVKLLYEPSVDVELVVWVPVVEVAEGRFRAVC